MKQENSLIMIVKSFSFIILIVTTLVLGVVMISEDEILIQSKESKTQEGHAVFNKIKIETHGDQDIWTMRQSHNGLHAPMNEWDTIRIIVDKKSKLVRYQQLKGNQEIELKAACYTCHANGPRAIRPDFDSTKVTYSLKDRITIAVMNLKMKSYGRVSINEESFKLHGNFREVPLKFFGKSDNSVLNVKSCTLCHNKDHFWGRGELVRQQAGTIGHLVKTGQMPPAPFTISSEDKVKIEKFVKNL